MPVMHWSPNLSVDNEIIDGDHKALIEGLNTLGEAIDSGSGSEQVLALLDNLIASTRSHFAREEEIMRGVGYPDLEPHRRLHEALLSEIDELRDNFEAGNMDIGEETLAFVKTWLTSHILESDKTLGGFLEGRG